MACRGLNVVGNVARGSRRGFQRLHVVFKKWPRPLMLLLQFPSRLKIV